MIICPNCKTENKDTANFCLNCGSSLESIKDLPKDIPETKKCPYCAEEIKTEAIVCRYCGHDLREEPNEVGKSSSKEFDLREPPDEVRKAISETVIYKNQEENVTVTNKIAFVKGKSWAISNIGSVAIYPQKALSRSCLWKGLFWFGVVLIADALLAGAVSFSAVSGGDTTYSVGIPIALIFAVLGIILVVAARRKHYIIGINSAGRMEEVLLTKNLSLAENVTGAIEAAISGGTFSEQSTAETKQGQVPWLVTVGLIGLLGLLFIGGRYVLSNKSSKPTNQSLAIPPTNTTIAVYSNTESPTSLNTANPTTIANNQELMMDYLISQTNHFHGNANAKVIIIEISDYQDPFSRRFAAEASRQIETTYVDTGKVRFGYFNFAFIGDESQWAAEAAECASDQNAFWQFHDYLFAHQNGENKGGFSEDNLKGFAATLGLDTSTFNTCLESGKYAQFVKDQTNIGRQLGITSTPTFAINGQVIVGAQSFESFKQKVDTLLKQSRNSYPIGTLDTTPPTPSVSAVTTASGLVYEDLQVGDGATAISGDVVSVNYIGWMEDGTKIDSNLDSSFSFTLGTGQVILGWNEGVQGMKVNGTRLLVIPPVLAYGSSGIGSIPPNATLIFEVQLVSIN